LVPKDWKLKNQDVPLRHQIEPVFFADFGGGELKKVMSGEKHDKFLAGIGGGFRFRFGRNIYLLLEWAKAVGDRPTGGVGPSNFHMMFQVES
jgi:hemolysin activation/secretion protein